MGKTATKHFNHTSYNQNVDQFVRTTNLKRSLDMYVTNIEYEQLKLQELKIK